MLKPRPSEDLDLPARLASSADLAEDVHLIDAWMEERSAAHSFSVRRIPFREMHGWRFCPSTGNLVHDTGRFFSVQGLRAERPGAPAWNQPVLHQPELGILGILAKEFDGVLHFLMQAKFEPGNPVPLMLSPTVQATWSNYSGVHKGGKVTYVDYFAVPGRGQVLSDVLHSEHGDWFYRKRNRNIIVEVDAEDDVPVEDDFRWMSLGQINELMARDNTVNMNARTVLACLPQASPPPGAAKDDFRRSLAASRDPEAGSLLPTVELLSWFTGRRSAHDLDVVRVPLGRLEGWHRTREEIMRDDGGLCRVVAVAVGATSREVAAWSQPLVRPCGRGLVVFLVKEFGGVLHVLVHARAEPGFLDAVELAPTVQLVSADLTAAPFLDQVPAPGSPSIRYSAIHAEEGGRFLEAESRYMIVEASDATCAAPPPPGYAWVTVAQLSGLLRHGQYVNVQARTLLACLNSIR
ncbi:NDP-hexose 2,3-dehydratase family protein [Actinocorallia populi]|uniref:NDP-hexose 2,3-dehydratase family protein n=1 Tax=Actinocorallia populi TaxID=2079200 RepID=UPI000D08923A|nr:NDP-hexose 2,3-dehydratase family protein [Actinocorallia populi]